MAQRVRTHKRQRPYELAESFLRSTRYRCSTPEQAFGRCSDVSEKLMDYLERRGIDARLVRVKGLLKPLGAGAPLRWRITPKRDLVHHVVLVNDTVVDLTGSQFGYEYGDITYPLDVLKERWRFVTVYGAFETGTPRKGATRAHDPIYLKGVPEEDVF
jgi:hypothetical protein